MITLLKNINCYNPSFVGIKDVLIVKDIIYRVLEPNTFPTTHLISVIDCSGLTCFPGLIDGHVHIIGGGGDFGYTSFNREISAKEIIDAGVTTVVGLLGADKDAKNLHALYSKAKALELENINTYIYTGNYAVPVSTLTGDITSDLTLIDKVIGVGEIAISDRRSSNPTVEELCQVAAKIYLGGLLSNKKAIMHFHLGDGKSKLSLIYEIFKKTDLPLDMFLPTHVNRNIELFEDAVKFALRDGKIDLTAGEEVGLSIKEAVKELQKRKVNMENVTISSDANASSCSGMLEISSLYKDIVECINSGIDIGLVLPLVTKNVASTLFKNEKVGEIKEGYKANIVIVDKNFVIKKVMSNGRFIKNE